MILMRHMDSKLLMLAKYRNIDTTEGTKILHEYLIYIYKWENG